MKKILLSIVLLVSGSIASYGQQQKSQNTLKLFGNAADFKVTKSFIQSKNPDGPFSLAKKANPTVAAPERSTNRGLNAETTIGRTRFDNQTNGSVMRRIVNSNGKLSVVWTYSADEDGAFPNRGVAYDYFDGTSWINMPHYDNIDENLRIDAENTRSGFTSILNIPGQGEIVVSHRTDIDALQFTKSAEGTQSWTNTVNRDMPYLWPRMVNAGPDGKTIHLIAIATEDTINGVDMFDGMSSAMMYCRSLDGGNTWDKTSFLLPHVDSTMFSSMSGDSYAIDAKGNTVTIVYGFMLSPVCLWKSTDNGETWTFKMLNKFPFVPWKDQVTDYNGDGDFDDEMEVYTYDTLFAQTKQNPDFVVINGENISVQEDGSRKFVVLNNDTLDVEEDKYVLIEKIVMVSDTFPVINDTIGSYVVFPPTDTLNVEDLNGRLFVVYGQDTLDVQDSSFVVRNLEAFLSDTFNIQTGNSYRFVSVNGKEELVSESGGTYFIVVNGDTLELVNNVFVLFPADTLVYSERPYSNDGTVDVLIDNNGKAHVWYGNMRISNDKEGDGMFSYYPGTSGIMYWSEYFAEGEEPRVISGLVDDDGNNQWDGLLRFGQLDGGGNPVQNAGPFPYEGGATSTPTAAIDANGKIYVFYRTYKEGEQYYYISSDGSYGPSFSHIYAITSSNNGQTWSSEGEGNYPTDLTVLEEAGFDAFTEYAFPSVAKVADNNIHLTYMSDDVPGTYVKVADEMYHPITNNRMVYLKLTPSFNVSTHELLNQAEPIAVSAYPNPAANQVNINIELKKSATVTVKVSNLLGQSVMNPEKRVLPAGKGILQLNTESLSDGIYLVSVEAGTKTYTSKIIINK